MKINFYKKTLFVFLIVIFIWILLAILEFTISRNFSQYYSIFSKKLKYDLDESGKEIDKFKLENRNKFDTNLYPFSYINDPGLNNLATSKNLIPLGLFPNKSYIKCSEDHGPVILKSDRFGFENIDNVWDSKEIDLLIIGDSFGSSFCVPFKDSITNLLNQKYSTINLSLAGNSPIVYAALSKNFLPIKKFKNVFILFYSNDKIRENNNLFDKIYFQEKEKYIKNNKIEKKFLDFIKDTNHKIKNDRNLNKERNIFAETKRKEFNSILSRIYNKFKLKKLREYINVVSDFYIFNRLPYSSKLALDVLKKECKINNCKPNLIFITHKKSEIKSFFEKRYKRQLSNYAKVLDIPFYDLTKELDFNDKYFASRGHHLSKEGYKLVANQIEKMMINNTK